MKKINKLIPSILITSILSACGGNSTPDAPPANINQAPVAVADKGLVQNNETLAIDVLANDTDADNDSLTISEISAQPENGTVEISDNKLLYTPNHNFAGVDTLSYKISDGKLTDETNVELTVNHTITLSGKITDNPIAEAKVEVKIGGEVFETTADAEGNYELPIIINDMSAMLVIRATGSEANDQNNVELVVVAGGVEQLLERVDDNRFLPNENNLTNATHISTATYLLVKDRNNEENVISPEQFKQLQNEVSSQQLIETASFIKLLIDNDAFDIPEGKTTLSALESKTGGEEGVEVSTADAIQGYLVDNNLVDENGEPKQEFIDAMAEATKATISDPNVVAQFTPDMFNGKNIIVLNGAKSGWNEYSGQGWQFKVNGSATNYDKQGSQRGMEISQADWSIVDGKLKLIYSGEKPVNSFFIRYPFDDVVDNYGFDESVKVALMNAVDTGKLPNSFVVDMLTGYNDKTVTLLAKTENVYQVNVVGNYSYTMIMPTETNWQNENPTVIKQQHYNAIYAYDYPSLFVDKTIEDIVGDWLFYHDYQVNLSPIFGGLQSEYGFMGDRFSITTTTATAAKSGMNFSPTLDDNGILILSSDTIEYKIKPIMQAGKSYLVSTEKWVDGELQYIVANLIAKFDYSYNLFTDNIVTEWPEVYLAHIISANPNAWDGDKLALSNVYGYKFNADGSLNRGIYGLNMGENNWDGIIEDHFYLGDDSWTWSKTDNIVTLGKVDDYMSRKRTWEVISVDEQGRALVFEYSIWGYDINADGVIAEDESGTFIRPRINIQKKDDLSRWSEAWQNTVNANLLLAPKQPTKLIEPKKLSQHRSAILH